ncbi:MAG: alanine racemase [Actinomycetales bacterium]|nr:MAG: alanine racemase [Actinomycetales bacterium]
MNRPPHSGSPGIAYVDLDAIEGNVRSLQQHAPDAAVLAVVKADAYGHGLLPCARAAQRGGATWLGTAQLDEAFSLRDAGITGRILTWLHVPGADFAVALTRDIDLAAYAIWDLEQIAAAARATGRTARVHLKVDTGLGRGGAFGRDFTELIAAARALEAEGSVSVVGIWSHFAYADAPDHPTVRHQQEIFEAAVREAERAGCRPEVRHLANSAATVTNPSVHYDLVRPGIAVYGLSPVPQLGAPAAYGLRPAMTLVGRLGLVKRLPAGQGLSYGHQYTTRSKTLVGLVPLGYADGIPRNATNVGPVSVDGRLFRISGRVCMDQILLDLGPDSPAREGDEVVFFGGEAEEPTAEDWAVATGTISYEIVTRIGPRVQRVHLLGGAEATE